jgi:NCAIR mutase (PurE)-related protein
VIFGKGKTPEQIAKIVRAMLAKKDSEHNILITRTDAKTFTVRKHCVPGFAN